MSGRVQWNYFCTNCGVEKQHAKEPTMMTAIFENHFALHETVCPDCVPVIERHNKQYDKTGEHTTTTSRLKERIPAHFLDPNAPKPGEVVAEEESEEDSDFETDNYYPPIPDEKPKTQPDSNGVLLQLAEAVNRNTEMLGKLMEKHEKRPKPKAKPKAKAAS